jgi:hypothetical protein
MADWHTPNIETLRRQQESLRAVIEAIGRKGELYPSLTDMAQHARELLDAMEVERIALSSEIVRSGEAVGRRAAPPSTASAA